VLTLACPESGGYLEVYDARPNDFDHAVRNRDDARRPDVSALASTAFDVPVGALVLLRSGDRLHRVVPIAGDTPRWTACSFMAEARDGSGVYLWG
jgi:hypothetical protein